MWWRKKVWCLLFFLGVGDLTVQSVEWVSISDYDDQVFPHSQGIKDRIRTKRKVSTLKSKMMEVFLQSPAFSSIAPGADPFSFLKENYGLPEGITEPLQEYDFIVVGAGSAGCVVASRLSEDRRITVLLLEAGQGESLLTDVPALAPLFQQTDYVWPYLMEPQPGVCMGMKHGRCFWPRGKAVGGTSVVNYMIYTRGIPEDWDRIAADGNYGWSYQDVLPYFIKSEKANLRKLSDSPYHGRSGELNVEDVPFRTKLSKVFLDASKELGHKRVDYNSPDPFGFSYIQSTTSHGRRHSSARAFLHNKKKRTNLHILPQSRVTKVIINPVTTTAEGVEFYRHHKKYRITARKEVILSAGPIESPHLLMLSGIGPREQLESYNIPIVQDLKVGETLYDHISYPGLVFHVNTSQLTLLQNRETTLNNVAKFLQYGEGPMTTLAGVETIGYIKTNISEEIGDYPDVELLSSCSSMASDNGELVSKGLQLENWLYNDYYKPLENLETFTVLFILLHPKSKGSLKLRSADPFDPPMLFGNYLQHPKDVATMVAAARYVIKLVDTKPFKKYGARLHTKKYPNCKQYKFNSDKYWECVIRTITATIHHQISTCKMGPATDPDAVVDPELRVYGVNNLRVADSGVIPRTTVAHTNAPAIMIGEKAAALIKRTWAVID